MAHLSLKVTVVTLPAGQSTPVALPNASREYLALMNIDTGNANFAINAPAAVDAGWPLDAASAPGRQGGGYTFDTALVSDQAVNAISAAGTRIAVLEG